MGDWEDHCSHTAHWMPPRPDAPRAPIFVVFVKGDRGWEFLGYLESADGST